MSSGNAWSNTCSRLNVKPKQFAILLVIVGAALGVLGVKFFVLKPRKAGASTPAAAKTEPSARSSSPSPPITPDAMSAAPALIGLRVETVALETRPLRDPFLPFFVYTPTVPEQAELDAIEQAEAAKEPNSATGKGGKGGSGSTKQGAGGNKREEPPPPEGPQGLVLKAIISSRVAVLNGMSVERGDVISDEASQTYTVEEIRERSIVLSDGHRRFTLGFAPSTMKGKTPPKNSRK